MTSECECLLISADLATGSRVQAAAQRMSATLVVAMSPAAALDKAQEASPETVIVDLSAPGIEIESLVATLRSLPTPPLAIIAFGPHVHEAKLAAARAAGCDQVLTRGQFMNQAEELVSRGQS